MITAFPLVGENGVKYLKSVVSPESKLWLPRKHRLRINWEIGCLTLSLFKYPYFPLEHLCPRIKSSGYPDPHFQLPKSSLLERISDLFKAK